MLYIYLAMLLLIPLLISITIGYCNKYAPSKIRLLGIASLGLLFLRYAALLVMFLSNNVKYLYYLKPVIFLQYLSIPIIGLTCLYIVIRTDKLKFNTMMIVSAALSAGYIYFISNFKAVIKIEYSMYSMSFVNYDLSAWVFIMLNTVLLVSMILLVTGKNTIKVGSYFIFFCCGAAIMESILSLMGVRIFPQYLVNEGAWVITMNYCIRRLKK